MKYISSVHDQNTARGIPTTICTAPAPDPGQNGENGNSSSGDSLGDEGTIDDRQPGTPTPVPPGRLDWMLGGTCWSRLGAVRHPDKWAGGAASPAVAIPIPLPRV